MHWEWTRRSCEVFMCRCCTHAQTESGLTLIHDWHTICFHLVSAASGPSSSSSSLLLLLLIKIFNRLTAASVIKQQSTLFHYYCRLFIIIITIMIWGSFILKVKDIHILISLHEQPVSEWLIPSACLTGGCVLCPCSLSVRSCSVVFFCDFSVLSSLWPFRRTVSGIPATHGDTPRSVSLPLSVFNPWPTLIFLLFLITSCLKVEYHNVFFAKRNLE